MSPDPRTGRSLVPAETASGLDNYLLRAEIQPLVEAWQTGRLAIVWAATPFDLVAETASRPAVIAQWQRQAQGLPELGHDLYLTQLPAAPILSLDPSDRLLRLFNQQGLRVSIVRDRDVVPQPGEHVFYPLAGELGRAGLVLTRQDLRQIRQDEIKRRWMLEPWLEVAREGAVLLLGADPAHSTFAAWWADVLGRALAERPVFATAESGDAWPAGVTPVPPDAITRLNAFTPVRRHDAPPALRQQPAEIVPDAGTLAIEIYRSTIKLVVQGKEYSGPNRIDAEALRATRLDLGRYGEVLFEGVFHDQPSPGGVQDRTTYRGYVAARDRADNGRLRIELRLDPNDLGLHDYLWEALKDPRDDRPLALQARSLLYRYQPGQGSSLGTPPRLKVLAAIANPTTLGEPGNGYLQQLAKLDLAEERRTIENGLARLHANGAVDYTILDRQHGPPISQQNLRAALRDGYHILHLVAHGLVVWDAPGSEFYLVLENHSGAHEFVSANAFKRLLDGSELRLVVLVSCLSSARPDENAVLGLGARLVQAGVPAVIAMQDLLPISAGRVFTQTFYDELARSGRADLAMVATRQAMELEDNSRREADRASWSIPALILGAPGARLFAAADAAQPAPAATPTNLQPIDQPADIASNIPAGQASRPAAEKPKLSRFQRMNLETQLAELQTSFETVTRRIKALDIDIGRAMSAADNQIFEERKAERVAERDEIVHKVAEIEAQLGAD